MPLNVISATTETCVFLYIGWSLLFLHSSAGFVYSYSGLYLNRQSVLSVFMQFAQFYIRTYNATKLCESLQPEASWGIRMHQIRFAPRLHPGPRWGSSRRSLRPPSPMGRGTTPHIPLPLDAFGVSISRPRRLRRLGLGAFGACWFSPKLFFVPARLYTSVSLRYTSKHVRLRE